MYYDASDVQKLESEKVDSSLCFASSALGWLLGPASCEVMPSPNYNHFRPSSAPAGSFYDQRQGYFDIFATSGTQELSSESQSVSLPHLPLSLLPPPHLSPASGVISPSHESTHHDHIPRPPNAFMLYRSDFLKKGVIPSHVERRQQNLSRIAGECWNMLSDEDKSYWHAKAAKIHAAHYAQYPNYKFRPSPRGINKRNQRAKDKMRRSTTEDTGSDRIRSLREKYTQLNGPAVAPARRRRRVPRSQKLLYGEDLFAAVNTPLPPSIPATPAASPSPIQSSLPYSTAKMSQDDIPSSPNMIWDQEPQGQTLSLDLSRPSSAAGSETGLSELMQDLDITPTAATFQQRSPMAIDSDNATWPSLAYTEDMSLNYGDMLGLHQLQLPFYNINYAELPGPSPNLGYPCGKAGDHLHSFYSDLPGPAACDPFCYGQSTPESVSVDFMANGEWTMQEALSQK
ncbi:hypothetical protein SERLA73DRAFT_71121 [Serpula lacrymans var. lacrymans S7.3]|uniref:HMG box domain-containing protein n=2 Tax=Serpula lacrymans var. lacrymans TaxID=341189 RepID=F8PP88_SERL3|nr:uncharacterized protein SERLADRAFT_435366 [Serpula lacrymans var. lacrymans S7.9]EGO01965.1 hypothetical protein SERLA73DRAFT_71121 [Serpula lacrymans var. lacrymans S7.3]EGO27592.1 hypothetical protein SERLADRAFT_435366 [Serpula lacrymans var. lacrymans S7.9]